MVDLKYRRPNQYRHNELVFICPNCDTDLCRNLYDHVFGIGTDSYGQDVFLVECDKCFERFYFHVDDCYDNFLDSIEDKTNKHFK